MRGYSKPLLIAVGQATHHGISGPQASQVKSQAVSPLQVRESAEVCNFCAVLEICVVPNTAANVVPRKLPYTHARTPHARTPCQVLSQSLPVDLSASANFVCTHLLNAVGAVAFAQIAVSISISQVCMALNSTWYTALPCSYDCTD